MVDEIDVPFVERPFEIAGEIDLGGDRHLGADGRRRQRARLAAASRAGVVVEKPPAPGAPAAAAQSPAASTRCRSQDRRRDGGAAGEGRRAGRRERRDCVRGGHGAPRKASHCAEKPLMTAPVTRRERRAAGVPTRQIAAPRRAAAACAGAQGRIRDHGPQRRGKRRDVVGRHQNAGALRHRFDDRAGLGADHRQAMVDRPRRTPCRSLRGATRGRRGRHRDKARRARPRRRRRSCAPAARAEAARGGVASAVAVARSRVQSPAMARRQSRSASRASASTSTS